MYITGKCRTAFIDELRLSARTFNRMRARGEDERAGEELTRIEGMLDAAGLLLRGDTATAGYDRDDSGYITKLHFEHREGGAEIWIKKEKEVRR